MNDEQIQALKIENAYLRTSIELNTWQRFAVDVAVGLRRYVPESCPDVELRAFIVSALEVVGLRVQWKEPAAP